jgi:hypothetical protein
MRTSHLGKAIVCALTIRSILAKDPTVVKVADIAERGIGRALGQLPDAGRTPAPPSSPSIQPLHPAQPPPLLVTDRGKNRQHQNASQQKTGQPEFSWIYMTITASHAAIISRIHRTRRASHFCGRNGDRLLGSDM